MGCWPPNWSVTGHSTSGVPVTFTRSVCLPPCPTPFNVPVMMVDSPGLSTRVSQSSGYFRSVTSPSPAMVLSTILRSLARYQAPSPVEESVLDVLVILNAICWLSPAIFNASFTSSRSPACSPEATSYFSMWIDGVMSGVRVHTMLDWNSLSLNCSVNWFSTRSDTFRRLHWMYARQPFSCALSADTRARYASVASTVTWPFSSAVAVNSSPPSFELSKPLPASLSPLAASTLPSLYRSRVAYTAHWPVYWSNSVFSGSTILHWLTCG